MMTYGLLTSFGALLFASAFAFNGTVRSQTIHGRVVDQDSTAIPNVNVSIYPSARTTTSGYDGSFLFNNVSPGNYQLNFRRIGYESASVTVVIPAGRTTNHLLMVMKSNYVLLHSMTVTAQPQPQPTDIASSSQSVSISEGDELLANEGSSPSSALAGLQGVFLVRSGPFTEKPVIRGLGYQSVLILEDGIRHEYQSWDDDDSPSIDALSLERIEIVRGPNSVLYGSDALGGVINYIHDDGTLPSFDTLAVRGNVTFEGLSNNTEGAVHASLDGSTPLVQCYLDVTARGAGNVQTPHGVMPNTGESELDFAGSVSTERSWGNLLLGYSRFSQHRDILAIGSDADGDGSASPYQSTIRDRAWLSYKSLPSLSRLSLDFAFQENDGAEYTEDDAPSPINNLRQGALSLYTKYYNDAIKNNSATVGASATQLHNVTLGPEPVIPAFRQFNAAVFVFDDYRLHAVDLSLGARYDRRWLVTSDNAALNIAGQTRNYHAVTGSFGLLWRASRELSFGIDVGSGWSAPNVEELFINGLQEGSLMYKMGNPALLPEQSFSTDLIIRISGDFVSGEVSAYYNRISRYIYLGPVGQIDSASGFVKYADQQANATLKGVDARLGEQIAPRTTLTMGCDFVAARNEDRDTWLPLTPANRIVMRLRHVFPSFLSLTQPYIGLGSNVVFSQNRVAPNELRTGGYTVFDLHFGASIHAFDRIVTIHGQVDNLLNRSYHDNMSLYRLYAYSPGVDFRLDVTVPFLVIQ